MMTIMIVVFGASYAGAEEKKVIASIGADGVQRVEILGGSYFFYPNHLVVKVNVPVEIRIRKEGGLFPHNFVLKAPEAGMDMEVDLSTDSKTISFTPTKAGQYPFYCDKKFLFLKSHREKGMNGIIEVQE
jgi:plastocyanin